MALIDAFLFNDELELLEVRLHELATVVDRFVLVEADKTYSGHPKSLHFLDNMHKFRDFRDKITHVPVRDMPDGSDPWAREKHQRNAIVRGLLGLRDWDVVMISDADEIPRASAAGSSNTVTRQWSFEQRPSYYYVNTKSSEGEVWMGTQVVPYALLKNATPQAVRDRRNECRLTVRRGGWHFSFLGGPARMAAKIKAYSHQEYNTPQLTDEANLAALVVRGQDLFTAEKSWEVDPELTDLPHYLLDNRERFAHLFAPRPSAPTCPQTDAPVS